jgi:hypothetical protein
MNDEYRGYSIQLSHGCLRCIKPIGKGSVVKQLKGLYTDVPRAMKDIDKYLDSKQEKSNGKAKSTDRG